MKVVGSHLGGGKPEKDKKRLGREGARGLTGLFVSINGKKELMLIGSRKKWTLEGWGGK